MSNSVNRKATITVDDRHRDIDALEFALKQLREVGGAPGNARITMTGAGPGTFIVSAEWITRGDGETEPPAGPAGGATRGPKGETLQP